MKRTGLLLVLLALICGIAYAQSPPPVPALPDSPRITSYSLTASACNCSVGFAIYGDGTDVDNWLDVFVNGSSVLSTDLTSGWSLSSPTGSLGSIARPITNAVLTFNAPQTGTINIVGARRPRRLSQFQEGRGVTARDLNQVITDEVAMLRETWDKLNRAIVGQPGDAFPALPSAATRANKFLAFDPAGFPIVTATQPPPAPPDPTPGMIGDGVTDNTSAFQALLTAAGTNGGSINLSCGIFVVQGATTLSIASRKNVTVQGQGLCTTLAFKGVNATAITLGDVFTSIRWGHMRMTTDGAGTFTGLTATMPSRGAPNLAPLFSVHHIFEDLHFTGDDYATMAMRYWNIDMSITNMTNVQIDNVTSLGALGGSSGTGVRLQGDATFNNPSVVINFKNYLSAYHNIGIDWEANIEGISVVASNFQSNNVGIRANPAVADQSELAVVNSQFGSNNTAGVLLSANVSYFALSNSLFEMTGSSQIGVAGTGLDFKIVGNTFGAPTSGANAGVGIFLQTVGGYGTISANSFSRLVSGITANSSSTYTELVISNNVYVANTSIFNITGGTGIIINEAQTLNFAQLPTCNSTIQGSTMAVDDNGTATLYHGAVTSGGTEWTRVFCPPTGGWVQN